MKSLHVSSSLFAAFLLGVIATTLFSGYEADPTIEPGAAADATASSQVDKVAKAPIKPGDWTQWGGTSYRNNTPIAENIPTSWDVGKFDRKTGKWIPDDAQNIKWVATVGSQTYGNPVIANGRLFVGTNNGAGYLKRYPADIDLGCLLSFNEADGKFLWQHSSEKLPTGRVHDWPFQGICCAPLVEEDRLWFVTSRGEVVCLDTEGFYDGEDDGPIENQLGNLFSIRKNRDAALDQVAPTIAALTQGQITPELRKQIAASDVDLPESVVVKPMGTASHWLLQAEIDSVKRSFDIKLLEPPVVKDPMLVVAKVISPADKYEADTVWSFDMMTDLGVSQHNMCSCSVTSHGDVLFVNTSNGVDESHINIPSPDAPSFMAMDKHTGEVYWTDKSPGVNILHGQWSSPTVGVVGGVAQVIFGGGDGWVYSFKADAGKDGKPELLWKFDANPKESKWILGGAGTRNNIIATPVIYDGLVYVAVGQDPEHGEGIGHLWCIDPTKRGDVSPQLAVKADDHSQILPHRRLQAVIPEEGEAAIDNPNSAAVWHYSTFDQNGDGELDFEEEMHRSCGTVAIKNDLLYIADFSGLFHCLNAKTGKVNWTYDMLAAAWGSPLIVGGHVYIGDEDGDVCIFKLSAEPHEPIEEINMGNSVYSTPVVANGVLFISNRTNVFAIQSAE